ncbi:MAG: hypothetical protein PHR53_09870, partial [Bacteroidales bacterium]|nr:hypothetical protein [Bacteroidales bacterium]
MQQKFHKEIKYFISFLLVTTLFIIGSFFLPHNFRGLIFYGLIFVIDWIMMRTIFPLYQLKKPWKSIVFIIHWLPLLILSSIVLIAIIIPFPIWESWLKKILILLAISGIVAQIVGFLFVIVYLLLRLFWHNSKKLRYIIDTGLSVMSIVFCLFITSPLWTQIPVIKYVNIPVQQLPAQFENYTIVQISDLHLDYASKRTIDRSVAMINAEHPDLIAVTGDMVTFQASEMD